MVFGKSSSRLIAWVIYSTSGTIVNVTHVPLILTGVEVEPLFYMHYCDFFLFCFVMFSYTRLFIIIYNCTCKLSPKVKHAKMCHRCINNVHNASVNSSCDQPPPPPPPFPLQAKPRAWAFFSLGWQIRGGGDSWAVKSPGVGTKKEGKCPILWQHCNIFHWLHTRIVPF